MASRASGPPASLGSSSRKSVVARRRSQEGHHLRVRADHVGDVEQRQPHLRRDVVRGGLRERVGRVLLAEPLLQLLVEPPGGLHPRHDHLDAPRVEQDPPAAPRRSSRMKSNSAGPDFVRMSRSQRGEGRLGCARSARRRWPGRSRSAWRAPPGGGPAGASSGSGRDEVAAVDDGLQRVPDQRIGPSHSVQEAGAARRRGQPPGDVDEQPPAGLAHRRAGPSAATRRARAASSRRSSSAGGRPRRRRGCPRRRPPGRGTAW